MVNFEMVQAYWNIGRIIVKEEQNGKERADYGSYLIKILQTGLRRNIGFTKSNFKYKRQFYQTFEKGHALRGEYPGPISACCLDFAYKRSKKPTIEAKILRY